MSAPTSDFERVLGPVRESLAGLRPSQRFLVGVSGGRDSVVLLHALLQLGFRNLVVVHVNHGLRGRASGADAAFVRRLATRHEVEVFVVRTETRVYAKQRGISVELAARELRHAAFSAAASRFRCSRLVLGHHADDQVETCLFNYLRGTGAAGLAGMQRVSDAPMGRHVLRVFRPLLPVKRSGIQSYAASAKLSFREDASNTNPIHTRNRLRHSVIPALAEAVGPSVPDAILRTSEILRSEDDFLRAAAATAMPLTEVLPVRPLRDLHLALQRRVLHSWLSEFGPPECGFAEVERVRALLAIGAKVAKVNLPAGCHARRSAGKLFLEVPIADGTLS